MADKRLGDHVLTKTHVADEAIAANRFVKVVTATGSPTNHVTLADQGEKAIGVSRDAYASGKLVDVVYLGTAWVETAENITAGDYIAPEADGKASVAAATEHVRGMALTDANSGGYVLVLLGVGGIY